jgi:hypothetical protein
MMSNNNQQWQQSYKTLQVFMKCYWLLLIVCSCFAGCHPTELDSADELTLFLEEPGNNLIRHAASNGYEISITYTPVDLLIYLDTHGEPADHERIQHLQQKYSDRYHFKISFSRHNHDILRQLDADQQSRLLQVLSYGMQDFVYLTTSSGEVIPLANFFPGKIKSSGNSTDLFLEFDKQKSSGVEWIKISVSDFGLGTGELEYVFKVEDLENVPRINLPIVL